MKTLFIAGILALSIVASSFATGCSSIVTNPEYKYFYDVKREITFPEDNGAIVYQGKIYVPLQYYSETIGKKVFINETTRRVEITSSWFIMFPGEVQTKELKREDFDFLTIGMQFEEIYKRVGPPAENVGSGFIIVAYDLDDGTKILLRFIQSQLVLEGVFIKYEDGSHEVILQ